MKAVLIVLGSPNSAKGRLGKLAIERATKCLDIFDTKHHLILCTGGFGPHFNTSVKPHCQYLKQYLLRNGIKETSFLPSASSANTVEDATKAKLILDQFLYKNITIITTEYHLQRVKLIFDEILVDYDKTYLPVPNNLSEKAIKKLEMHEFNAISGILKDGLYY